MAGEVLVPAAPKLLVRSAFDLLYSFAIEKLAQRDDRMATHAISTADATLAANCWICSNVLYRPRNKSVAGVMALFSDGVTSPFVNDLLLLKTFKRNSQLADLEFSHHFSRSQLESRPELRRFVGYTTAVDNALANWLALLSVPTMLISTITGPVGSMMKSRAESMKLGPAQLKYIPVAVGVCLLPLVAPLSSTISEEAMDFAVRPLIELGRPTGARRASAYM